MPRMSQTPDAPIQSKLVKVFELNSTDHLDAVAPTTQQGGQICAICCSVVVDV